MFCIFKFKANILINSINNLHGWKILIFFSTLFFCYLQVMHLAIRLKKFFFRLSENIRSRRKILLPKKIAYWWNYEYREHWHLSTVSRYPYQEWQHSTKIIIIGKVKLWNNPCRGDITDHLYLVLGRFPKNYWFG